MAIYLSILKFLIFHLVDFYLNGGITWGINDSLGQQCTVPCITLTVTELILICSIIQSNGSFRKLFKILTLNCRQTPYQLNSATLAIYQYLRISRTFQLFQDFILKLLLGNNTGLLTSQCGVSIVWNCVVNNFCFCTVKLDMSHSFFFQK